MAVSRQVVSIDFRKWLTRPHWRFDMMLLDKDEWGTWLWTPPGSTAQRGDDPARTFGHLNVKLIAPGQWWTAMWNDGSKYDLYVDIITPPGWGSDRVTMIDLDLDLIRISSGHVIVDDEDEFAAHQLAYGYPQPVIDKARSTADDLHQLIQQGQEPFATVGQTRMRQAAKLATEVPSNSSKS